MLAVKLWSGAGLGNPENLRIRNRILKREETSMTAFSKRIAATAAAAALTAGGVFAIATPAFAATTTPTETTAAAQIFVDANTIESGTTSLGWVAEGLQPGDTYTITLSAPGELYQVPPTGGNEYVVADNGTASGEIKFDDGASFSDGDYVLTLTPATGGPISVEFTVAAAEETTPAETTPATTPAETTPETTPAVTEPAETVPVDEPTVVVDADSIVSGTTGINWAAAGFTPGATYTLTIVTADGAFEVAPPEGAEPIVDENGLASSQLTFNGGEVIPDGEYTLVVETAEPAASATVTFTVGAVATEPTETAEPTTTPEPTETTTPTATPTTTPTETEATEEAQAPALGVEKDTYAQAETIDGVNYAGAYWEPGVEITIEVTEPNGDTTLISPLGDPEEDIAVDENGEFAGTVTYMTYEDTNGNGQWDAGEARTPAVLPIGDYVITATQGDVTETVTFKVVADAAESIPASDDDDATDGGADNGNAGKGGTDASDSLAVTGADDAALLGMLAGGLVLVAAGATTMIVRRRQA